MKKWFLNLETNELVDGESLRKNTDTIYPPDYSDFDGYLPVIQTPQPNFQRDVETITLEYEITETQAIQKWVIYQRSNDDKLAAIDRRIVKIKMLVCDRVNQDVRVYGYPDLATMAIAHNNQADVNRLKTKLSTAISRVETVKNNATVDNIPDIDLTVDAALA